METNARKSNQKFLVSTFILLLSIAACPHIAVAQTNTFPASGNVGIGTTSPVGKLEVTGSIYSSASETNTVFSGAVGNNNAAIVGPQGYWAFRSDTSHRFNLDVYNSGSPFAAFTVNQSGNVGIGTSDPSVGGSENYTRLTVQASDSTAVAGGIFNSGSGQVGFLIRRTGTTPSRWYQYIPPGSTDLRFYNGSDLITLQAGGNVGIGTTSPGARLDVRADAAAAGSLVGRFGNDNASGGGALRVYANTPANSTLYPAIELTDNTYWLASIAADRTSGLRFRTGSNVSGAESGLSDRMVITATGNVGIGTSSPASPGGFAKMMHLLGASNASYVADAGGTSRAEFGVSATGGWLATADNLAFRFATNNVERMRIASSGTVGIGTSTPNSNYKLDVNGDTNVTGSFNASGTITGGTIVAKYQDMAEWVESSQYLPAGTVVVLDQTKSNQVIASTHAYDTRGAGVVSAQPGITLGEQSDDKVLVATTGRVKVMVDAASGPIDVGDLLVTSDIAGVAKKSEPLLLGVPIHRPGTLIGKALEPLARGRGEILVLLTLQ
jgi:hypothetical protein